jgi:O-antigen/teichoic acid export membrane protein
MATPEALARTPEGGDGARALRPLTGGAVTLAVSRGGVAVAGSLATVAVARILGPAGSGGYAVAISAIVVLTVLSTMGIEHGIAYYVGGRRWAARDAFRSAQRIALGAGLLGAAFGLGVRILYPAAFGDLSVSMTAVVVLAMPFVLSWYYASFVALASEHFEGFAVAPLVQSLAALLLVTVLSVAAGLRGALIGVAVAHMVAAVAMLLWARRWLPGVPEVKPADPRTLRDAASFGVKGYAANALNILNYRLDIFILSAVASAPAVGRYAVAVAVTQALWIVPPAVGELVFPRVAALTAGEGEEPAAHLAMVEAKGIRHTAIIVAVMTVLVALGLIFMVVPIFGPAFKQSVDLGLILLPGVAMIGLLGVLLAIIVGRGRPGYSLLVALSTTPVTIALYLWLIPWLKGEGAALASTISYTCSFALVAFFFGRVTGGSLARVIVPTRGEWEDYRRLLGMLPGALGRRVRGDAREHAP